MAQWTSEYAILRDLSVAQGKVPVAIERIVGAGDKPPSLNITEETEEEFYKHCSADANVTTVPDLGLIQKMLDMVRDVKEWSDDEDPDKAIIISKLDPQCSKLIPNQQNASTSIDQPPTEQIKEKPKKRQRNIAVESILQAIADNTIQNNEIILRKPNDFIIANDIEKKMSETEALGSFKDISAGDSDITSLTVTEKVNGWLKTQTESPFPKKTSKVTLEAASIVFKKKEKVKKIEKCPKQYLKELENSPMSSSSNSGEYKPSILANEYYQKYVERSKFKESFREDIWTKAERKMKEIDEKRRREVLQSMTSPSSASQGSGIDQSFEETQSIDALTALAVAETKISRCLDMISLPQHRHRLTGDCIVCEVMRNRPSTSKTETIKESNIDVNGTENNDCPNKQLEDSQNTENVESMNNVNDPLTLNEDLTKQLTGVQITELINEEFSKFIENGSISTNNPKKSDSLYENYKSGEEIKFVNKDSKTLGEEFNFGNDDAKILSEEFNFGNDDSKTLGEKFNFENDDSKTFGEEFNFGNDDSKTFGEDFKLGNDDSKTLGEEFNFGNDDSKTLGERFKSFVGNEDFKSDTLYVENVDQYDSNIGIPFKENCLSDDSF